MVDDLVTRNGEDALFISKIGESLYSFKNTSKKNKNEELQKLSHVEEKIVKRNQDTGKAIILEIKEMKQEIEKKEKLIPIVEEMLEISRDNKEQQQVDSTRITEVSKIR